MDDLVIVDVILRYNYTLCAHAENPSNHYCLSENYYHIIQ